MCNQKTGVQLTPPLGKIGNYAILSGPQTVKIGSLCFNEYYICTDSNACTLLWEYAPGCKPGGKQGHWQSTYRVPAPCPPDIVRPPGSDIPLKRFDCVGEDLYEFEVFSDGRRVQGALITLQYPPCMSPRSTGGCCEINAGAPPGAGYTRNPSGDTSATGWEYAMGVGQTCPTPCWRKRQDIPEGHGAFPTKEQLIYQNSFAQFTEYFYSLHRTSVAELNDPLVFKQRSLPDWTKEAGVSSNLVIPDSSDFAPITVTFGNNDAYKEFTVNLVIYQQLAADNLTMAREWAAYEYLDCAQIKYGKWDFLKSYFPFWIKEAVSVKNNSPSTNVSTHTLAGGVEVFAPEFVYSRVQNSFYTPDHTLTMPPHIQSCQPAPVLITSTWQYIRRVYTVFPITVRVPRCILLNGGTLPFSFTAVFDVPPALTKAGVQWSVINDEAPIDFTIITPGCNKGTNQVMVYEYPNAPVTSQPTEPIKPPPPSEPMPPNNPNIRFLEEETWVQIGMDNSIPPQPILERRVKLVFKRTGFPDTYYVALSPADVAQIPSGIAAMLPHPTVFFWRATSDYTDFGQVNFDVPDPGQPDGGEIYRIQETSLGFYYNQCLALQAAYQAQLTQYGVDMVAYQAQLELYQNVTLPAYNLAIDAYYAALKASVAHISVGMTEDFNTLQKGGIYLP